MPRNGVYVTTEYKYDRLNRMTQATYAKGTQVQASEEWAYDSPGPAGHDDGHERRRHGLRLRRVRTCG